MRARRRLGRGGGQKPSLTYGRLRLDGRVSTALDAAQDERFFDRLRMGRGGSIAAREKRPRGRPATGRDPAVTVRIPAEVQAEITAWIERQPDPKPTRSEAIRRLIEKGLAEP